MPDHLHDHTPSRPRTLALLTAAAVLLLAGCASAPARPAAAVAEDGPDCAVADVLLDRGYVEPGALPEGPEAGTVPADFEPVAVVRCGGWPLTVVPEGTAPRLLTPTPDPVAELEAGAVDLGDVPQPTAPATPDGPREMTVQVTELRGDLGPLLDQLARPSEAPRANEACMAMMEIRPVVYLVDAAGSAIRAQWPSTSCGFLLDGALAPLDALEVTATWEQTLVVD
jgi:hypothetical protein